MKSKYIYGALVVLSVGLLAVALFGYLAVEKATKKAKPTSSSVAQEPAKSYEMGPSITAITTLAETLKPYGMVNHDKTLKDEESSNISPDLLVDGESGLLNLSSNVSSSNDQQESALLESPLCLFEENEEIEASSKNQNDLENEKKAEENKKSEILNENFEASEEEIIGPEKTELEFQPADTRENTVTLENDVETEPEVSNPSDVAPIPLQKLVCNPEKYNIPSEIFELSCGNFKSSRGNAKILRGILITFLYASSMEIPKEISEKFDIVKFICSDVRLEEYLEEDFLIIPSGIYETIGGEYEFEDESTFLIPKGVKIHVPEKTMIQYPKGVDIKSMIRIAFDGLKMKKKSRQKKSGKQARKKRNKKK